VEVFLAIAVVAVAIATLVVAMSFGKRTDKQVSAILNRAKDTTVTNNETAINELRAQLFEGLARLDRLSVDLQAVQESLAAPPAWGSGTGDAADAGHPGSADDGRI
jgi:uncharacterized protein YoxC